MKLLPVLLALMIVVPNLLGGEEEPRPGQVLIKAKIIRGAIPAGSAPASEKTLCVPSVICEEGNLATVAVESDRVFTSLDGKEKIRAGTRLEFRPAISTDGKRIDLDLDVRITQAVRDHGFARLRRSTKLELEPGKAGTVRLGSLPSMVDGKDVPLSVVLVVHPVK